MRRGSMKRKGIALLLAFLLVPSAWALTLDQARHFVAAVPECVG